MRKAAKTSPFPEEPFLRLESGGDIKLERIRVMRGFLERGLGLMFRPEMPPDWGQALLFPNNRELHGFGMRFALDVLFLDKKGQFLSKVHLAPGRLVRGPKEARHCLEAPEGTLDLWPGEWRWVGLSSKE